MRWTDSSTFPYFQAAGRVLVFIAIAGLTACASSSKKVLPEDAKTIEQIYSDFAGADSAEAIERRKRELKMRDAMYASGPGVATPDHYVTGFPPKHERIEHLFPTLPNPELFMYVFPHAVGETGVPIPAYYTRFTMYERSHYTLPNESVTTVRRNATVNRAIEEELKREQALAEQQAEEARQERLRDKHWPKQP